MTATSTALRAAAQADAGAVPPSTEPHASPRYDLISERGRGGIGRVIEAFDNQLDRFVALKELHQVSRLSEARFIREAKITARLEHPAIVPVHELGEWPDGTPYYAMKLVAGKSLKQLIRASENVEQRLALVQNVLAVAEAIGYAHSEHIIHRDLKPSNVIVGDHGETIVIDWGLAKDLTDDQGEDDGIGAPYRSGGQKGLTLTGSVMGTPAYMSPEQARGEEVDARTDVYALGAMLYQVLAGVLPFDGDTSDEILRRVLSEPPRPIREHAADLPPELTAIVDKAMARDAGQRYPNARELADDLRRFQTGQLVSAHRYSARNLLRRWVRRHRAQVATAAVALAALGVFGTVSIVRIVRAEHVAVRQRTAATRAQSVAEKRAADLVIEQARGALARDPTEAVAWLKHYPPDGDRIEEVRQIGAEASLAGVARDVIRLEGRVRFARFAPDGRLATGTEDGTIQLWDLETGRHIEMHGAHEPFGGVFSPDGTVLATAGAGPLQLWSTGDGRLLRTLSGATDNLGLPSFSPDGRLVAAGSTDDRVRVWNTEAGTLVHEWTTTADTYEVRFVLDGRGVAAASQDGIVYLWNVDTGEERRHADHKGAIWSLEPSPDGASVATSGADGTIRLWDFASDERRVLRGHTNDAFWAVYSPDGERMASIGHDSTVRVWNLATGSGSALGRFAEAPRYIRFSPDGRFVATTAGQVVDLWDLTRGTRRRLLGHGPRIIAVDFSPDGTLLATGSTFGRTIRIWRVDDERSMEFTAHVDTIHEVAVSSDGDLVGSVGADGSLGLWNIRTNSRIRIGSAHPPIANRIEIGGRENWVAIAGNGPDVQVLDRNGLAPVASWRHPSGSIVDLALSRSGDRVASVSTRGSVFVVEPATGATWSTDVETTAAGAAFTPSGDELAIAHAQGVDMWSIEGSARRRVLNTDSQLNDVRISADGRWLAAAGSAGKLYVLALPSLTSKVLTDHREGIARVAFSPDSRLLASTDEGGDIRLWTLRDWSHELLLGHTDTVSGVAFSPDGNWLVSASADGTARLWETGTGRSAVMRHGGKVRDVEFLPDGRRFVTCSYDRTVRLWDRAKVWADRGDDLPLAAWLESSSSARIEINVPVHSERF